jgi:hypothetical protein
MSLATVVALVLGFVEFWLVFKTEVLKNPEDTIAFQVFPSSFVSDRPTQILFLAFTLFLGLLRVSWAVSGKTFFSWLCVVFTHVIETVALWSLALSPHFNKTRLELPQFIEAVVTMKFDPKPTALLLAVPAFVLIFLLSGPGIKKNKNKSE